FSVWLSAGDTLKPLSQEKTGASLTRLPGGCLNAFRNGNRILTWDAIIEGFRLWCCRKMRPFSLSYWLLALALVLPVFRSPDHRISRSPDLANTPALPAGKLMFPNANQLPALLLTAPFPSTKAVLPYIYQVHELSGEKDDRLGATGGT